MCQHCNYSGLLKGSGLGYTPNRHRVLEVVGNNNGPLSAQQIFDTLQRTFPGVIENVEVRVNGVCKN